MILPTKHISPERSLLGLGATVLQELDKPQTITRLWERLRPSANTGSFERFILALDLLYALGTIEIDQGLLRRSSQ
jgi:ABC-three component (ABC-3C) system Middle Component 6